MLHEIVQEHHTIINNELKLLHKQEITIFGSIKSIDTLSRKKNILMESIYI